jgi:hypothetical protein
MSLESENNSTFLNLTYTHRTLRASSLASSCPDTWATPTPSKSASRCAVHMHLCAFVSRCMLDNVCACGVLNEPLTSLRQVFKIDTRWNVLHVRGSVPGHKEVCVGGGGGGFLFSFSFQLPTSELAGTCSFTVCSRAELSQGDTRTSPNLRSLFRRASCECLTHEDGHLRLR